MLTTKQLALKEAHKTDGNADFRKAQDTAVEVIIKGKTTAFALFLVMAETLGSDFGTLPIPGSEKPVGNRPADKFTDSINGKDVDGTFWNTFADATEYATAPMRVADPYVGLDSITGGPITVLRQIDAKETPFDSMGDHDIEEAKKLWRQRRDANRKAVNTAAKIYFQQEAINGVFPSDVRVSFKKDAQGFTDEASTTPIVIAGDTDAGQYKRMSVGEFLALSPEKAKANAADGKTSPFSAVIKSGGKGKKQTGQAQGDSTKPGDARIKSWDQFETAASMMVHYLAGGDPDADIVTNGYNRMMKAIADSKNADDRKARVELLGDMCFAFDGVWKDIESEYHTIKREKAKAKAPAKAA